MEKEICAGPMAVSFKCGHSSTAQKRGYNSKKRSFRCDLWPAYKTWPLFSCLSRVFKNAALVRLGLHVYKRGLKKRVLKLPRFVVKEGGAACYSKSTISKKLLNKLAMLHIEKKHVS